MNAIPFSEAVAALNAQDRDLLGDINDLITPLGMVLTIADTEFELYTDEGDLIPLRDTPRYLLDSGVMYALNSAILHPLGLALALSFDTIADDVPLAFVLLKSDEGPIVFEDSMILPCKKKLFDFIGNQPTRPSNYETFEKIFA